MFGDRFLSIAAKLAGFSQKQLAIIEQDMPATRRLIALVVKLQPTVQKFLPIVNNLTPIIKQIIPLAQQLVPFVNETTPIIADATPDIEQASKEFQAVWPALNILIKVIERDLNAGKSRDEAVSSVTDKIKSTFEWKGF